MTESCACDVSIGDFLPGAFEDSGKCHLVHNLFTVLSNEVSTLHLEDHLHLREDPDVKWLEDKCCIAQQCVQDYALVMAEFRSFTIDVRTVMIHEENHWLLDLSTVDELVEMI